MTTSLTVPIPPSVNALYRNVTGKGRVKTERYRIWLQAAGWDVNQQKPEHQPGMVAVAYRIPWPKDKRRRDLGNFEKALSDLLTIHHIIDDDSKIVSLSLKYGVSNTEGKVEIAVSSIQREAA